MNTHTTWVTCTVLFTVLGCGEFDNATLIARLQDGGSATSRCGDSALVNWSDPVLPGAVVGRPWVGWMHAQDAFGRKLRWTVDGVPEGIQVDPSSGTLAGIPETADTYTITASVWVDECPDSLDTKTFTLIIAPECTEDCAFPTTCGPVQRDTLFAIIDGIGPGSALARDGMVIHRAALPGPPALPGSHTMVLTDPDSPSKDQVVIHYHLPGGVLPPIEGDTVDVRYIHGKHGDKYLFLTSEKHPRFVVYDGFLTPDELVHRCPSSELGTHCPLMDFQLTPTPCAGSNDCGHSELLAVSVTTAPFGSKSTTLVKSLLMPGQAGQLPDTTLLRIVDAHKKAWSEDCLSTPFIPYSLSFYILPVAFCTYVEIDAVDNAVEPAPTGAVFSGRVLYPPEYSSVDFQWSRTLPSPIAQAPLDVDEAGNLWSELPLTGDYRFFLTGDVTLVGGQVMTACNGLAADFTLRVPAPQGLRVELSWSPLGGGPIAPDEAPTLWVNDTSGNIQSLQVQAVEFDPLSESAAISVHLPKQSQRSVQFEVRIWLEGSLLHVFEDTLAPDEEWFMGTLKTNGEWHTGRP